MVVSDEALKKGFDVSAMECLVKNDPSLVSMLRTQYRYLEGSFKWRSDIEFSLILLRSNKMICSWSSGYFYQGQVESSSLVSHSLLRDLPGVANHDDTASKALMFVDTVGKNYKEEMDSSDEGGLVRNYDEAFVVEALVLQYLEHGLKPHQIGVIAPYWGQVAVIRSLLKTNKSLSGLEISTVDGFQVCTASF